MGSTVFRIPSDVIKPTGYCPRVLYTSSGILNTVDPLASVSELYLGLGTIARINIKKVQKQETKNIIKKHKKCKRCRDGMPKGMQTR